MGSLNNDLSERGLTGYGGHETWLSSLTRGHEDIFEQLLPGPEKPSEQLQFKYVSEDAVVLKAGAELYTGREVGIVTNAGVEVNHLLPPGVKFYDAGKVKDVFSTLHDRTTGKYFAILVDVEAFLEEKIPAAAFKSGLAHEIGHSWLSRLRSGRQQDPHSIHGDELLHNDKLAVDLLITNGDHNFSGRDISDVIVAMNKELLEEVEAWNHGKHAATAMGLLDEEYEYYQNIFLHSYWGQNAKVALAIWSRCRATEKPAKLAVYDPFLQDVVELTFDQFKKEVEERELTSKNNTGIAIRTLMPSEPTS